MADESSRVVSVRTLFYYFLVVRGALLASKLAASLTGYPSDDFVVLSSIHLVGGQVDFLCRIFGSVAGMVLQGLCCGRG